jgi:putative DeoR family transcriptional regulator (stage III sporulation protein D)
MKDYIEQRVLDIANFLAGSGSTVRDAAKKFHVSKSTVHKDMMDRLPYLHSELARSVRVVMDVNKAERHLRGGQATCMKYKRKKPESKAGFSAIVEK